MPFCWETTTYSYIPLYAVLYSITLLNPRRYFYTNLYNTYISILYRQNYAIPYTPTRSLQNSRTNYYSILYVISLQYPLQLAKLVNNTNAEPFIKVRVL